MIEIKNRKSNDYSISDRYIAGVILVGNEIKQIVRKECDLTGSYIALSPPRLIGSYIKALKSNFATPYDANRSRLLLLTKSQIRKLSEETRKGKSLIPLRLFSDEKGRIKLEFGIGASYHKADKRQKELKKEHFKEMY